MQGFLLKQTDPEAEEDKFIFRWGKWGMCMPNGCKSSWRLTPSSGSRKVLQAVLSQQVACEYIRGAVKMFFCSFTTPLGPNFSWVYWSRPWLPRKPMKVCPALHRCGQQARAAPRHHHPGSRWLIVSCVGCLQGFDGQEQPGKEKAQQTLESH
jgi:hypothetical protein